MTLSTSRKLDSHLVSARRYALAAAGCVAFSAIYSLFSHGVTSPYMSLMYLIPLVSGTATALLLFALGVRGVGASARRAWALGVASLTVASCLRGIFDIAGTSSPYLICYLVFAAACGLCAIAQAAAGGRRAVRRRARTPRRRAAAA